MRTSSKLIIGILAASGMVAGTASAGSDFFYDVPQNHWAYPFIRWSFDHHLMTGPGGQERIFQPNRPVTRAELAQSLRLLYDKIRSETSIPDERAFDLERELPDVSEDANNRVERFLRHWQEQNGEDEDEEDEDEEERGSVAAERAASARSSARSSAFRIPPTPSGRVTVFASLSGSQEVPRVTTSGRGSANLRWTSTGLHYDISVNGLTGPVTAAHFHRAVRGQSGPVIAAATFVGNRSTGVWAGISAEDWRDIVDGRIYVNVHTARYPDGEIRGQLQLNR